MKLTKTVCLVGSFADDTVHFKDGLVSHLCYLNKYDLVFQIYHLFRMYVFKEYATKYPEDTRHATQARANAFPLEVDVEIFNDHIVIKMESAVEQIMGVVNPEKKTNIKMLGPQHTVYF